MSLDGTMNKFGSVINLLSLALGESSAVRRLVIMSCEDEKLTIPVTPRGYDMKTSQNNKTVNVIDFGEVQLFGNPTLKRLHMQCFFPHPKHDYPFVVGDVKEPSECVQLLTKWKEEKKPIRVIITDSDINLMMALKVFNYDERDGTRDIYYDLSFIEYKDLNTPLANNDKQTDDKTGLKGRASDKAKPDTVTIKDKAHDILDASKKAYGDYTHWRNIMRSHDLKDIAINNIGKLQLGKKIKV